MLELKYLNYIPFLEHSLTGIVEASSNRVVVVVVEAPPSTTTTYKKGSCGGGRCPYLSQRPDSLSRGFL